MNSTRSPDQPSTIRRKVLAWYIEKVKPGSLGLPGGPLLVFRVLGGSWVVTSGAISPIIGDITIVILLITLLI